MRQGHRTSSRPGDRGCIRVYDARTPRLPAVSNSTPGLSYVAVPDRRRRDTRGGVTFRHTLGTRATSPPPRSQPPAAECVTPSYYAAWVHPSPYIAAVVFTVSSLRTEILFMTSPPFCEVEGGALAP